MMPNFCIVCLFNHFLTVTGRNLNFPVMFACFYHFLLCLFPIADRKRTVTMICRPLRSEVPCPRSLRRAGTDQTLSDNTSRCALSIRTGSGHNTTKLHAALVIFPSLLSTVDFYKYILIMARHGPELGPEMIAGLG